MTLSNIATVLVEDYLPDAYRKYNFLNFQQTPHYRSYNDSIPIYLQGRPRQVILHCLDRKGSSNNLLLKISKIAMPVLECFQYRQRTKSML